MSNKFSKFWDEVKFLAEVKAIILKYNKYRGRDVALDGDQVDALIERIRNTMNLEEGNITPTEYFSMERHFGPIDLNTVSGVDAFVRKIRGRF